MREKDDVKKQDNDACAPGCSCGRGKMVIGIIILVVVGVLVVRAMVNNNDSATPTAKPAGVVTMPVEDDSTALETSETNPLPEEKEIRELDSLSELNSWAADKFGVFVFMPGREETSTNAPMAELLGAAKMLEPQLRGGKIGMFALKVGSTDYEQLAKQMTVPGVIVMVKGGGMSATSGDITEEKLVQALLSVSNSGGCGSGCGPAIGGGPAPAGCN